MDFRNICSKIDIDSIRAKIPPLPDVMTQFKLPKSMAKLKSRSKIFRSSREDISSSTKRKAKDDAAAAAESPVLTIPPSDFVNHTPQRISTISSLVDQKSSRSRPPAASIKRKNPPPPKETFYRSAGGIDDYCPSPSLQSGINAIQDVSMSPSARAAASADDDNKLSFAERMQKGYKDVSDFRLKHIFVKKTVVRRDDIALNHYIDMYSEDRQREERYEEKLDRVISDNYDFEFKTSRRKSDESFGISSPSEKSLSIRRNTTKKLLSEHSGDESGMELSPPNRKPGIASTRFARVRKVPLRMSLDEDEGITPNPQAGEEDIELDLDEEEDQYPSRQNTLQTVRRQKNEESKEPTKISPPKTKSFKQRLSGLSKQLSGQSQSPESKISPKKRKAPLTPQQSEELEEIKSPRTKAPSPSEDKQGKPFVAIKENFKRFQKSFKLSTTSLAGHSGAESEADDANEKVKPSKTQQFAERLKRFRSVENVDRQTEDEDKTQESPLHKFTSKLQEWKKSMKKKAPTQNTDDDDAENTSPQKRDKPVGTLIKRLKHIRSRKTNSTDDPDDDEEGGSTYRESFRSRAKLQLERGVAAASHVPQMTMEKIKETKKIFRKRQENNDDDKDKDDGGKQKPKVTKNGSDESDLEDDSEEAKKPNAKAKSTPKSAAPRHYYSSDDEDEDEDEEDAYDRKQQGLCKITTDMEPHQPKVLVPLSRAAWTNKSIHSDSLDTGEDDDDMLPRVLLHQNNSDIFESTIIIAVTRPISRSQSPIITELPPDSPKVSSPETKADSWVPSCEIISGFRMASDPIKRELSKDTITSTSSSKGHSRKHSMDSSSEDSWIKDVPRGISTAVGLNKLCEMDEPWKVQTGHRNVKLSKAKSIDIFEKSGGLQIFEDFDDELKNIPVVKIEKQETHVKIVEIHATSNNVDSFDQDSGEELEDNADDDNSSRVTRILKQPEGVEEKKLSEVATLLAKPEDAKLKSHLYGNSAESLMGHLETKNNSEEESDDGDDEGEEDNEEEEEEEEDEDSHNMPPSAAPSPPPSISPPPPPLPERRHSCTLPKLPPPPPPPPEELPPPPPPKSLPPPLISAKPSPPVPAQPPPKVPERTPAMSRVAKPLVKTSSLRLAYDEQVNPQDVGKVNKLISQFEPKVGRMERPRLIPRRPYMSQSSEDYSEDEEEEEEEEDDDESSEDDEQQNGNFEREKSADKTPTNKPTKPMMQKSFSIHADDVPIQQINNNNNNSNSRNNSLENKMEELAVSVKKSETVPSTSETTITRIQPSRPPPPRQKAPSPPYIPSISISNLSLQSDQNSNISQASSEYGSPVAYASSLTGSNEVTPLNSPKDALYLNSRRSRRSMTRDDERYFSFDSDEENSYYSIGSTRSNRYVVDL